MLAAQEKLKEERSRRPPAAAWSRSCSPATCELQSLKIDPDAVDPEDVEMLQDMVVAADQRGAAPGRWSCRASSAGLGGRVRPDERARALGLGGLGGLGGGGAPAAPAACRAAPRTVPRAAPEERLLAPPAPAAGHRAREAAGDRQPHGTAPGLPRAARLDPRRDALAEAISDVKEQIGLCEICFNLAEGPRCAICLDERRDRASSASSRSPAT